MVDLAGSERAADRVGNDRERVEEGRLINESLMGLKDCVRARSKVSILYLRAVCVRLDLLARDADKPLLPLGEQGCVPRQGRVHARPVPVFKAHARAQACV